MDRLSSSAGTWSARDGAGGAGEEADDEEEDEDARSMTSKSSDARNDGVVAGEALRARHSTAVAPLPPATAAARALPTRDIAFCIVRIFGGFDTRKGRVIDRQRGDSKSESFFFLRQISVSFSPLLLLFFLRHSDPTPRLAAVSTTPSARLDLQNLASLRGTSDVLPASPSQQRLRRGPGDNDGACFWIDDDDGRLFLRPRPRNPSLSFFFLTAPPPPNPTPPRNQPEKKHQEEDRVVAIRFGSDADPTCMVMDEALSKIADAVKAFAVIYLVDLAQVPDFNDMYELYNHPLHLLFFYRNRHIQVDLGTGDNNKVTWTMSGQELIDILEVVYRGASKGRGLVVSPKDYSTKYRY
jgi:DIM1 family U5 snRNP protein